MNLKSILFALLFATVAPLQAQQVETDPEELVQSGKFADASKEYALRVQASSYNGDSKTLADACIGLYKMLWLAQAQDKYIQMFKPCPAETMAWLSGKVDRELQPIYRPLQFPQEMIALTRNSPVKLEVSFDIDEFGKPTEVRIVNGLKFVADQKSRRSLEKAIVKQFMAWRWLPRIENGKPIAAKILSQEFTYSLD